MRLTKGMYAEGSKLFGLSQGQMRRNDLVHNGGWYNHLGEKLGWGDLAPVDFLRIQLDLAEDEVFIVLPERASYWEFVEHIDLERLAHGVRPEVDAPGIDYVVKNACYVVMTGRTCCLGYGESISDGVRITRHAPLVCRGMTRKSLREVLKSIQPVTVT